MSQIGFLLGMRRKRVAALAIGSLLSGLAESAVLAILAQTAASLVAGASRVHVSAGPVHVNDTVGTLLLIALVIAVVRLGLQILVSILPAQIAADIQSRLRSELFGAFTRASWSIQSRDREGHLQELLTNQVGQATSGAIYAAQLVTALLTFLMLVLSAVALNLVAALVVLAGGAAMFALFRPLSDLGHRGAARLSSAYFDYAGGVSEAVRVAEETQVFGAGEAQRRRVDIFIANARRFFFRTQVLAVMPSAVYQSLVYVIVLGALAALNAAHAGHIASLGAVVLVLIRAGTYGQQAQTAYQNVRQALPYVDRMQDAQRRYGADVAPAGNRPLAGVRTLVFEDVSFEYEAGRPVLTGISFEVVGGEAVGIVGPSGAGKSTLSQILLRLRQPDVGCYLVNGIPAAEFRSNDWHRQVAFVPQEPRLLHASVADNIRYFRDLDDDAVQRAARLAAIHDEIVKWPHGYETLVGPRVDAVSGGQQQRICLARALAAQPAVLVLDEPTSALDPHSESLIHSSLAALKGDLTLFVVAHRMSTAEICGRVMVIVDGRLEAFDSAALLRETNPYYRSASALAAGWTAEGSSAK